MTERFVYQLITVASEHDENGNIYEHRGTALFSRQPTLDDVLEYLARHADENESISPGHGDATALIVARGIPVPPETHTNTSASYAYPDGSISVSRRQLVELDD